MKSNLGIFSRHFAPLFLRAFAAALLALCFLPACIFAAFPVIDLKNGDRVVFVGDTLIEREQTYGYLEQRLTVRFPERDITFRNLGWSADTPEGESRASFDFGTAGKGFEQLTNQIASVQPTVVFIGYGMANSFQGEAGIPAFKAELNKLVDAIQTVCTNRPIKFIFLSPIHHENLGGALREPTEHNQQLALYTRAVADIAAERKASYISIYDNLLGAGMESHPPHPLTDNGIHLSAYGYLRLAEAVEKAFVWEPNLWRLRINEDGVSSPGSYGTRVYDLMRTKDHIQFSSMDSQLVSPYLTDTNGRIPSMDAPSLVQVDGLKSGRYELKEDSMVIATGTAKEWGSGVAIEHGAQFDQATKLNEAIRRKNELYFYRWRPQNETYLFGFRKHEQGQNAKEIPMFDKLIAEQEAIIAKLRQPVEHKYELTVEKKSDLPKKAVTQVKPETAAEALGTPKTSQMPPDLTVAPGFEVSLYAESPLLAKPIQMNFDPRGRLWVVSSSVYPQIQPGEVADDKVLILEDTKGIGKVDKSTVFADGLLIPTGVQPGDGGVYVGQGTQLLFFKDNTGAGKADEKRIVLSGFGTEDTHHIVHTLKWGPDGMLYFDQSIYIHSHIETPNGVGTLNSGGIWHLRPSTMDLGVYLRGFCNPWGHQFDEFGQSFVTDGAGGSGISYGIPGAVYFTYANMRRELASISPGSYPKFCSLELIQSRQFPDDWQGNAITCDFRAHRVVRFAIDEKDGGYATRQLPDLITTTNATFRPIDVKLGPDGALYIADWSNPIIQHGEVDFRDPRRDHEHGRIWRVVAKGRPLMKRPQLVNASNRDLFKQLLSPEKYNQEQARRVLTERGPSITNDLAKWAKAQTNETALLEALWMYQSLDVVEPALLGKALNAKDAHVRAAATRVAGYWHPRLANASELLEQRVNDEHPRVRIEAVRALAEIPAARSAELVLNVVNKPMDSFLDYAVWLSINDLAPAWVAAVKSGEWKIDGHEKQLEFALKAVQPADATTVLSQVLQKQTIARDGTGPWIELVGQAGGEHDLHNLYDQAVAGGFDEAATVRALKALAEASRLRSVGKPADPTRLSEFFLNPSAKIQHEALVLAGAWKTEKLVLQICTVIKDNPNRPAVKKAAFESLRQIGGATVIAELPQLIQSSKDAAAKREATLALAAIDMKVAQQPLLDALNDLKYETEALAFWRSLLGIKDSGPEVAKTLPKTGLSPVMAKAGLRAAREGGRSESELIVALTRGADLESAGFGLTDAEMKKIGENALASGDPARGETIFRRKDISCISCHAIGGVGGKVGPDLTSIGASSPVDYLIESVFYPNRKIKEGFHSVLIETTDGEEIAGILVRENPEQLVLRNATDREVSIAKKDIKTRKLGDSLMPSGLVDNLTSAQQLDLFRFLSELGKPGPYDASKGNVARTWKLLPDDTDAAQLGNPAVLNATNDLRVLTALSLVDGRLTKDQLVTVMSTVQQPLKSYFPATQIQVSGGAALQLKLTGMASRSTIWFDGKPLAGATPAGTFTPEHVAPGIHTILLQIYWDKPPEFIRLEATGGTFVTN